MSDMSCSDESLVIRARGGDTRAFESLFDRYKRPILNFIYRLIGNRETAEEVAQEVFMKAYNNLDIFDPNKKFAPWIYTIARNLAKNSLRDRKYFADRSLDEAVFDGDDSIRLRDVIADVGASPDTIVLDEELNAEAQKVLDSMPFKYKEVITLCSIQGMTHKDAAAMLGCSIASISIRLEEAKRLFMKKLGIDMPGHKGSEGI
jgi:RNA polymerase sigma-70 factor (ECF subfamily)